MASAAPAAPAPRTRTFAALLEEYAVPPKYPQAQDVDGLEDDIATLSYENALKAHSRYRREPEPAPALSAAPEQSPLLPPQTEPSPLPGLAPAPHKSASVTVRLTAVECEQIRARAAEARLTVSAYLRSCAFEIETLRSQVKQAVARMGQAEERSVKPNTSWLRRLFARIKPRSAL